VWINSLNYVILLDACPFPYQDCYHPEGFSPRVAIGYHPIGRYRGKTLITRYQASREPHDITSAQLSIVVWKRSPSSEERFYGVFIYISLLDRIWSLWLVRFTHSPTNFIFWLNRLIFSVSINSHSDNIYLYRTLNRYYFVAFYCMWGSGVQ
jgi:hypothetical protein